MPNRSLRTRFVLFALACLLPFAAVLAFVLDRTTTYRDEQAVIFETSMASSMSRSVTSFLTANTDALEGLAQQTGVVNLDPDQAEIDLGQARRVRPELSGLFLVNTDIEVVANSGTEPDPLLAYVTPQLQQTVSQNIVTLSQRIPVTGDINVVVLMIPVTTVQSTESTSDETDTTPASDEVSSTGEETPIATETQEAQPPGRTTGVLAGVIQVDRLSQSVLPSNRGTMEIAIAAANDIIFSTSGIDRATTTLLTDHSEHIETALEGGIVDFSMTDVRGVERNAVAAPVGFEFAPWVVITTQPAPTPTDGMSLTEGAIAIGLGALVVIAFAVVLAEVTARPLRILSRQSQELHQGTLKEPIVPVGVGEIRTLSERFAEMADQINSQVAGLEESQHDRERQAAQMRDLLRRTNRMQEDERRRIAGEIHDAVSPLITGALYQARALQMSNGSTPEEELDSSLASVSELLERAADELHGVIFELRPPDLDDIGLVAAIEAYVHTIQRTGLSCRLEVSGPSPSLTPEVRLSLYRIVQEALHNVVRHAGADEAVVHLETTPEVVRLTIKDNGAGFDPAHAVQPTSLGLLSMQERADAIGASFTIVTRPGGGTAIVIERANSGDVMSDEVLESMMLKTNGGSAHVQEDPPVASEEPVATDPLEPAR